MKWLFVLTIALMAWAWVPVLEAQTPPLIGYDDISVREDAAVIQVPLELSTAPTGLSGFIIDLAFAGSTISGITVDSAFTLHAVDIQSSNASIQAVDLMRVVGAGVGIPLAVIEIVPAGVGVIDLTINIISIDDDDGFEIPAGVALGTIEVRPFPTLPGASNKVRDLDGDGLYEDLNGNGRFDFDDVVKLFANMDNPDVLDGVDLFDWNANGRVDFDDVRAMFDRLKGN